MTSPVSNNVPYLRTSRNWPLEADQLSVELSKTYVDIANAVNLRSIAIFEASNVVTGEQWFKPSGNANVQVKNQTLRKVFTVTDATLTQTHGLGAITRITRIYGAAQNSTNYFPLPYVDVTAANNQIAITLSTTQLIVTKGAGAPPAITTGYVVVEWIP